MVWNMNFIVPYIGDGIIIPTDFHSIIFQRDWYTMVYHQIESIPSHVYQRYRQRRPPKNPVPPFTHGFTRFDMTTVSDTEMGMLVIPRQVLLRGSRSDGQCVLVIQCRLNGISEIWWWTYWGYIVGHKTIRIANKILVEFEQWLHFDTLVDYFGIVHLYTNKLLIFLGTSQSMDRNPILNQLENCFFMVLNPSNGHRSRKMWLTIEFGVACFQTRLDRSNMV